MAQSDTVDRILDAAEELFAERGFSETSLRMITSKANVNLAAVNYHFGSKNALIQAVFARFLTPFSDTLEKAFDDLERRCNGRPPSLHQTLWALTESAVRMPHRNEDGISIFMRLLGLAYTQSQGHLRKFLEEEYSEPFGRFMGLLKEATPQLSAVDRYWRIQFMLGATAFTMSSSDALREILENKLGVDTTVQEIAARLVPFLASGLQASDTVAFPQTA
ncbi:transcriptional regulator PsrA [Marinobacter nanhaiticus D15-8W]|uniref:TetR/AcrR family transcriptional regulator n=1 Tax=Marinobacter nanhaiticus D15-8W TaxID=626887 RepID=N6WXP0_9GAMM|nr:TetR/AcrR family transcriptional regulator [Marinobacter nanhaiticus]ENO13563.1 TetR/AcrR family transcriptional regulator [Marinobacter nanhaiticus D15-8W]BES70934.1 transcriptional regulator PsrA [Marinobacter nanhaiticus D15-8W]